MRTFTLVTLLATCLSPIRGFAQSVGAGPTARKADFPSLLLETKDRNVSLAMLRQHKAWVTPLLWSVLINRGVREAAAGNGDAALFAFRVAENVATEIGNNGLLGYALYREGYEHFSEGNIKTALDLYRQSTKLFKESGSIADEVVVLSEVGSLYLFIGDYAEAESCSQKSLALAESEDKNGRTISGLPAEYGLARAWSNLGEARFWEADYDAAVDGLQKARVLWETIGGTSKQYGAYFTNTLINLGNSYRMIGAGVEALDQLNRALEVAKILGDKKRMAACLVSIGVLYQDQRDYSKSEEFLDNGLALFAELNDAREIASAKINKGVLRQRLKDYDGAIGAFREALGRADQLQALDLTVAAQEGLGVVYYEEARYLLALEWFDKALSLAKQISDKLRITELYWREGQVFYALGDYDKAATSAKASAHLATQLHSPLLTYLALTLNGRVLRAEKAIAPASGAFKDAINAVEEMRGQVAGAESEQELFFEDKLAPYHEMVSLLVESGNAEGALSYAERAKGRVLLDVLRNGRIEINKSLSPKERSDEAKLYGDIVSLNTRIRAERMRDQPDQARISDLESRLHAARNTYETFENSLYAEHSELSVKRGRFPTFSVEDAAAALHNSRAAILEYVVTDDQVFIFTLTKDAASSARVYTTVHSLKIKRSDLSELIEKYRTFLSTNHPGFHEAGRRLYDLLVKPVEHRLRNKTTICIVPDGPLWNLPFQALQAADDKYLLESSAIYYAPSLQVLLQMKKRAETFRSAPMSSEGHAKPSSRHSSRGRSTSSSVPKIPLLYGVANPGAGGATLARSLARRNSAFVPLPETETEVRAIADDVYGARESTLRMGEEANEETVKAEIGKYRVIHLATHAVLDDDDPLYSYVVLAPGSDSHEDGLLEARELMQMNLKAELVVLSACDTARGRVADGEGMIGMTWALFVAGVPTTVASQWQVPSESTTKLMVAFHKNLLSFGGKSQRSIAEAWREAILPMIRDSRYRMKPYYWAGFVIVGDSGLSQL